MNRQKSIELAGRVDLGLVRGLRLAEHGRGVDPLAPRTGQQVGGASRIAPRSSKSSARQSGAAVSAALIAAAASAWVESLERAQHVLVVVRLDHRHSHRRPPCAGRRCSARRSCSRRSSLLELGDQRLPLGAAGRVGQVRLVDREPAGEVMASMPARLVEATTRDSEEQARGSL